MKIELSHTLEIAFAPFVWRLAAIAAIGFSQALAAGGQQYTIPVAGVLPSIDGKISAREWDEGVTLPGFVSLSAKGRMPSGGDGYATFLSDGVRLFAAWRVRARNVDVDGGLRAAAKGRDGAVYDDDGVELVVHGASGGKIAHFIVNSIGTVYDSLSAPEGGTDVKWNCPGLKVATSVHAGWWETELSVPLAEIAPATDGVMVNAAVTFSGRGSASLNASDSHIFGPKLPLVWKRDAVAVQLYDIGNPHSGYWAPKLVLAGGDASRAFKCEIRIGEDGDASAAAKLLERKTLRAGQRMSAKFSTRQRRPFRLDVRVEDAATGEVVYSRSIAAVRGAKTDKIPPTASFDIGESEGTVFHYPGYGKMRVTVSQTPGRTLCGATCTIAGGKHRLSPSGDAFTVLFDAPEEDGEYPIDFAVDDGKGMRSFEKVWTLVRRRQAWEDCGIGKGRVIVPPFKPLAVADGKSIDVLLRRYTFGEAGLPSSVVAMGRELLSAPAYFEGIVDGQRVRFSGKPPAVSAAPDGYDAQVRAEASAAGVSLRLRATAEQDGFIWNEVDLSGCSTCTIERLTFVMPLHDREAPLMHACTVDRIRANPAGCVPAGEGIVWDSRRIASCGGSMVLARFVPYVWLGEVRRGISWFMNSSCGMNLSDDAAAVRIVREGGTLRMEADFINAPVALGEGRSFAFGMEATPVKERDRALECQFQGAAGFCPDGMTARHYIQPASIGLWNMWARTPHGGDWSLAELAAAHVRSGGGAAELKSAYDAWQKKNDSAFRDYAKGVSSTYYGWIRGLADWGVVTLERIRRPSVASMYSDPTLNWEEEESQKAFRSEWVSGKAGYVAAERNFLTPSCIDYVLYGFRQRVEHGITGLYFDDMFPMVCRNPDTAAHRDPEGRWHGNVGILEMRELVRRAAVMQAEAGVSPRLLQIHMTNCLLVPCFSFATSALSWEDHYGEEEFQKRFARDYILAESLGGQIGAEPVALDGIHRRSHPEEGWAGRFRKLTRTQQAMLLPMGVKTSVRSASPTTGVDTNVLVSAYGAMVHFGFFENDCRFVPDYDNDGAIGGIPTNVWIGSYRRQGKALAILGNQSGEEANFKLKVDGVRLGFRAPPCFADAETDVEMTARVKIPAYDFRIVEILDGMLAVRFPAEGAEVSQLMPAQARAAGVSWSACRRYFDGGRMSRALKADGCRPRPVELVWTGGMAPFTVTLRRKMDGKVFFSGASKRRRVSVDSLEIAREWEWTVADAAGATATGTFRTADVAPRLVRIEGVPNARDLGGRKTADGRRVRQGLLFRSSGLNNNSEKGKDGCMVPGSKRLSEAERARILRQYGFKCDVDLRRPDEVYGMSESPLGSGVKWANLRYAVYGGFTNAAARANGKALFREILDTRNYPLVFHCIAGADRTGTVAFLLNGLLGVSMEDALKDYLATGYIDHGVTDRRHLESLDAMVAAMNAIPGGTFAEKTAAYFRELGFTDAELAAYREFMLEPVNQNKKETPK